MCVCTRVCERERNVGRWVGDCVMGETVCEGVCVVERGREDNGMYDRDCVV